MARLFTIDASVFLNAFHHREEGHQSSRRFLDLVRAGSHPIIVPTLVLPEVAAVLTRAQADADRARAFARQLERLPNLVLVPLDIALAREAVEAVARGSMRGSDAVYAAVAQRFGSVLVSRDSRQRQRVAPAVQALAPEEAVVELSGPPPM